MTSGSVDLQLPCLSLMSLQTKTCSRTQFDREGKITPAFTGPWNIVWFRCQDLRVLAGLIVEIAAIAHVWPLRISSKIKHCTAQKMDTYEKKREPCIEPFLLLTSKSVFGPSSGSKQKQWVLCEWEAQAPQLCVIDFSKPESSEVAVHMESNCDSRLYRHSHNPLPILQQTPWQTGGTEADNPLSKQVHVAVIAHCSPSVSDWFCSQVSWWTEPELRLLRCEGYSPNQQ